MIVIESIERFDAPKTAITTLLAGVVAGAVAGLVFPVNPYHLIEVSEPVLTFLVRMKYFLLLAVIISIAGKIYSVLMISFKRVYSKVKSPVYIKMFYLVLVAYIISLMQVNLTGGGEQFLLQQAQNGSTEIMWVLAVMLLHFGFSVCSVSSGLPGGNFIPTLVTGGLLGQLVGLVAVKYGIIEPQNITYVMLISMSHFWWPLSVHAYGDCADNGDNRTFRSLLSLGGGRRFDVLFYGVAPDEVFQCDFIRGYD